MIFFGLQTLNYIFKQTLCELGDLAHTHTGKNHGG